MSRIRWLLTARGMISPKAEPGDRTLTKGGVGELCRYGVAWLGVLAWDVSDVCLVTQASGRSKGHGIQRFVIQKGFPASGIYLLHKPFQHFSRSFFFGILSYCRALSDCMRYSLT